MSKALVVGTGRGVWDDLALIARREIAFDSIIAVNFIGTVWPLGHLPYWISLHSEAWIWRYWHRARANGTSDRGTDIITPAHCEFGAQVVVPEPWERRGSSGLYAAGVALRVLNFDAVLLAGVPMDDSGHFYDPPAVHGVHVSGRYGGEDFADAWTRAILEAFDGRVRSMSGRTREWLGGPDD